MDGDLRLYLTRLEYYVSPYRAECFRSGRRPRTVKTRQILATSEDRAKRRVRSESGIDASQVISCKVTEVREADDHTVRAE